MTISTALLAAAMVTFTGYVPPHLARDGVRFQLVAEAGTDVPAAMRACRVDDFAVVRRDDAHVTYQFAVTQATEANTACLRARLPAAARLAPLDHWTVDAKAD